MLEELCLAVPVWWGGCAHGAGGACARHDALERRHRLGETAGNVLGVWSVRDSQRDGIPLREEKGELCKSLRVSLRSVFIQEVQPF